MPFRMQLQIPMDQKGGRDFHRQGVVSLVASQLRLHPRDQLQRMKRLCDVIVRAHRKAGDLVRLPVLGGQHDDRIAVRLSNVATDRKAVAAGQHDV